MKNVGILTITNTINYGALLQAYALQEIIGSMGLNAEILQYTNEGIRRKEQNAEAGGLSARRIYRSLIMGRGIASKTAAFRKFEERHINRGKVLDRSTLDEINEFYDFFITGSDQVWNMTITHQDWHYFLDFAEDESKIIAYAPSFGNKPFPEECRKKAGELLDRFKAISVREETGKNRIFDLCKREAQVALDPTLLLDKQEWLRRTSFIPPMKHYILLYFPHHKKSVIEFIKKLRAKTKLPVVYLSISPRILPGVKTIYDASPDEFLGWVNNADYVVTGSFHGTAFALNFEKQFFYEPLCEGGRIENIVRQCGTENRSIRMADMNEPIDYTEVRQRLDTLRNESKRWLLKALNAEGKGD